MLTSQKTWINKLIPLTFDVKVEEELEMHKEEDLFRVESRYQSQRPDKYEITYNYNLEEQNPMETFFRSLLKLTKVSYSTRCV